MLNELLVLHGIGGQKMARRNVRYYSVYDPSSRSYVRRSRGRRRGRGTAGLGSLGAFGQGSSLKATLGSVKGVVITGVIAASGAVVTDQVFDKVGASLDLAGWKREAAKIATGIVLGIAIAKLLKKPKIAAAFAIGPVVSGLLNIFAEVMAKQGSTAGLGLTTFQPTDAYSNMYAPFYGADQGLGLTTFTQMNQRNFPGGVPQGPPRRRAKMPMMA
jgi:hypothetical protein